MSLVLHIFRFSHFCEKVQWTLDHLGLEYEVKYHLPGLHMMAIKKMTEQTAVPVLEDDGATIYGSKNIITHLCAKVGATDLVPQEYQDAIEAWHLKLDEIAPILRGLMFMDVLSVPDMGARLLTRNEPGMGMASFRAFFKRMMPMLLKMTHEAYPDRQAAFAKCHQVLDEMAAASKQTGYLVGDQFSLADLVAAAIYFPICFPPHSAAADYALGEPKMHLWLNHWQGHPATNYITDMYARHRTKAGLESAL